MSVTWGKWVDAWKQGTNTNDSWCCQTKPNPSQSATIT